MKSILRQIKNQFKLLCIFLKKLSHENIPLNKTYQQNFKNEKNI